MFKNRTFLGIFCIIIAFVIIFFVNPQSSTNETVTVLVAKSNINSGDKIEEDMVEKLSLSKYNLPSNIITSDENIVGTYAKVDILKNDFFTESKISVEPVSSSEYLANLGDKQAISISLKTLSKGLSGKIETGDIVSIIVPESNDTAGYIPQELKYVEVIAVTDDSGTDTTGEKTSEEKNLYSTVTLLVNEEQSILLANLEDTSSVHISLVHRGNDETKTKYLEVQDSIFAVEQQPAVEQTTQETSLSSNN